MSTSTRHSSAAGFRLCGWCAAALLAEIGLYASYRGHDARFHWFTHFFLGATAAFVVMTTVALRHRRAARLPLAWVLLGHLVAAFPDVLFLFGIAHKRWMDVFLGHVSTHFMPGRNTTWYAAFLLALAAYLITLDRLRVAGRDATAGRGAMAA